MSETEYSTSCKRMKRHTRGSRMFCQRGANCDSFFKVDEGRKDPIPLYAGKWHFAGGPMMEIQTSIAKKP